MRPEIKQIIWVLLLSVTAIAEDTASDIDKKPASDPIPANPTPMQLVKSLASDNPAVRESAKQSLRALGRGAIEPLEFAALSEETEVRLSAVDLLIALRGRGFLGVGLEEEDSEAEDDDNSANKNNDESSKPKPVPIVRATQVLSYLQYVNLGVKKPFPAEKAGIHAGDRILAVNGLSVYGVKDLMRVISTIGPARVADVTIERLGKQMRVQAVLTRNPTTPDMQPSAAPPVDLEKELDGDGRPPAAHQSYLRRPFLDAEPTSVQIEAKK